MPYPTAVSHDIAAPAEMVWALVADLARMGEWSPENTGARLSQHVVLAAAAESSPAGDVSGRASSVS
jgi:hypothetical protein